MISRTGIHVNTSISDTDYTPSSSSDKIKRLQKYHCRKVMVSQTQISKTKKKKKTPQLPVEFTKTPEQYHFS
jgi:hypothetical protein